MDQRSDKQTVEPVSCVHETVDPAYLKLTFVQHILDKRYHLELWLDERMNSTLTLNAILGTLSVFILDHLGKSPSLARPAILLGIAVFTLDLLVCCYLQLPRFRSRKQVRHLDQYEKGNVRTTVDIERYRVGEYKDKIFSLSPNDMIRLTADQIKQVNSILVQERWYLNLTSMLSMIGVCAISFAVLTIVLDYNWIGLVKQLVHP